MSRDNLSLSEAIPAILLCAAVVGACVLAEHCATSAQYLAVRARPWVLGGLLASLSHCGAQSVVTRVCEPLDRVGPALTIAAQADEDLIEAEARAACLLCRGRADERECCDRGIDAAIGKHSKLRGALRDVASVTDRAVIATHETGVCK